MHAFHASGGSYNPHLRVIFGSLQKSLEPVFWTCACCSFNWVTTDAKAHKSNFIMLSFGTSAQGGNTNRQLSEKQSFTIWHRHSNSLCHTRKATLACKKYCLWAGIQKRNKEKLDFLLFYNTVNIQRCNWLVYFKGAGDLFRRYCNHSNSFFRGNSGYQI